MEKNRINIQEKNKRIWTIFDVHEKKFLHEKVPHFYYETYEKKDINSLVAHMRRVMAISHGIGLSANQLGFPLRVFVAQLPSDEGKGYKGKFYAIFNPIIAHTSSKRATDQEGCLSIPNTYGEVSRAEKILIEGLDKNGRSVSIKAEGLLARIFQHETDHLNGILFTSEATDIFTIKSNE